MDELKQLAKAEIQRTMRKGRELFKMPMAMPKIEWKSRRWTNTAGWYYTRENKIVLYEYYLEQFGEDYVMRTAPHEAAHAVMAFAHGDNRVKPHGPEFQGFLKRIGRDHSIYHGWGDRVHADKAIRRSKPLLPHQMVFPSYPVKIRTNSQFVYELIECEWGSYEDWQADPENCMAGDGPHQVEILQRHKAIIEIRNVKERELIKWAIDSGTIDIHMPKAAERMSDIFHRAKWPEEDAA